MNVNDRNSCSPLHLAAGLKNSAHVELLLNNGSDPSTRDRAGATALHYATFVGCVDTVQTLMRHPDVNDEPDCKGWFISNIYYRYLLLLQLKVARWKKFLSINSHHIGNLNLLFSCHSFVTFLKLVLNRIICSIKNKQEVIR